MYVNMKILSYMTSKYIFLTNILFLPVFILYVLFIFKLFVVIVLTFLCGSFLPEKLQIKYVREILTSPFLLVKQYHFFQDPRPLFHRHTYRTKTICVLHHFLLVSFVFDQECYNITIVFSCNVDTLKVSDSTYFTPSTRKGTVHQLYVTLS